MLVHSTERDTLSIRDGSLVGGCVFDGFSAIRTKHFYGVADAAAEEFQPCIQMAVPSLHLYV